MASIFEAPGLYIRAPDGGVEDVVRMGAAGFHWLALNVGDYELGRWDLIRARADDAGVACLPWARVRSNVDVWRLMALAEDNFEGGLAIINAENELDTGTVSTDEIALACDGCDAAISTEPWLYATVDWSSVRHMPIHLQLFPQENSTSRDPRGCRAHAYSYDLERVHFMLGIHDLEPAAFAPRQNAYSVYVADDVSFLGGERDYRAWRPSPVEPLELPFTGPLYGPSRPDKGGGKRSKTAKALKIACHRVGVGNFDRPNSLYNAALEGALANLQRLFGISPTGQYGRGTYELLKTLMAVTPGTGYALGPGAVALIEEDAS